MKDKKFNSYFCMIGDQEVEVKKYSPSQRRAEGSIQSKFYRCNVKSTKAQVGAPTFYDFFINL